MTHGHRCVMGIMNSHDVHEVHDNLSWFNMSSVKYGLEHFLSGFCDPRSPRYNLWAMYTDENGKESPIVPGNTNEVVNNTMKPWGPIIRSLGVRNAEVQKVEICDIDCLHKSYKLKRKGFNPEFVVGFPLEMDYYKSIKRI